MTRLYQRIKFDRCPFCKISPGYILLAGIAIGAVATLFGLILLGVLP